MRDELILWLGLVLAPIAWFASLEVNLALAPITCPGSGLTAVRITSGIALLLTVGSGALSWTQWYGPSHDPVGSPSPVRSRKNAMALGGMILSTLFAVTILAQAIPNFMLGGCE